MPHKKNGDEIEKPFVIAREATLRERLTPTELQHKAPLNILSLKAQLDYKLGWVSGDA
jgi:hypothetical protein